MANLLGISGAARAKAAALPLPTAAQAGRLRERGVGRGGTAGAAVGLWAALGMPRTDFAAATTPAAIPGGPPSSEPTPRRFASAQAALEALLQRGRTLGEAGMVARLPVQGYLDALGAVLSFIASHPVLHAEVNLSAEMCGAVLRVAQELSGSIFKAPGLAEPLFIPPPLTVQHEEAIRTGVVLLAAYRQAVRQVLRGPKAAALRTEFGLENETTTRNGEQVCAGIVRFLHAAERYPEVLSEARLTGPQLLGLAAQERVLRALSARRQNEATAAGSGYRTQVLHLALESFFDRYSAALLVRMLSQPEEQLRGLALAPRTGVPRSGGFYLPDYAACRVTDSGRLVF